MTTNASSPSSKRAETPDLLNVRTINLSAEARPEPVSDRPDLTAVMVMPAITRAGVGLAQLVLAMMTGSIILLIGYLAVMDYTAGNDIKDAYRQIINPSRLGTEILTLGQLERYIDDLGEARKTETADLSVKALANAQALKQVFGRLRNMTSADRSVLTGCAVFPHDSSRITLIDNCLVTLKNLRDTVVDAATGASDAQIAGEFATKMFEQRQSLHNFWIQAAQLILLNLLLPLMTALFGYIFGTQQALRQNDSVGH